MPHQLSSAAVNSPASSPSGAVAAEYSKLPSSDNRVTLVVDGTRFIVDPAIFTQHPETMLGRSVLTRYWIICVFC